MYFMLDGNRLGEVEMQRRDFMRVVAGASFAGASIAEAAQVKGTDFLRPGGGTPLARGSATYAGSAIPVLLASDTPDGDLARKFVRYVQGLGEVNGVRLDDVVTPDVRCIEMELAGWPPGIETLRSFRKMMNSAVAYGSADIYEMLVNPAEQVTEVKIRAEGTHVGRLKLGEVIDLPATGRTIAYDVRTLNLFKGDKMVMRWDRTNLLEAIQRLSAPEG